MIGSLFGKAPAARWNEVPPVRATGDSTFPSEAMDGIATSFSSPLSRSASKRADRANDKGISGHPLEMGSRWMGRFAWMRRPLVIWPSAREP